ncbi:MAG: hypothetical protein HMLIMOIP_000936 [Candidatus Nitrosomirales archaeon]|jgi:hypothetical protein
MTHQLDSEPHRSPEKIDLPKNRLKLSKYHEQFTSQIKDGIHTQDRHNTLVHRLVELIATHPGISHNELKRIVRDKDHITSTKTYDNTIKELLKDEIVERKRGKGKRIHYYIYDNLEHKIIHFDKKFSKEISHVKRLISKIEADFPDYNDYTAHGAFELLDYIKTNCWHIINWYKGQDNVNLHAEDSILDSIKQYFMKQKNDVFSQELWRDAQVVHKQIKNSRKEICDIITQLLEIEPSQKAKLIEKLIENTKLWKSKREELFHYFGVIGRRATYLRIKPEDRHLYVEPN